MATFPDFATWPSEKRCNQPILPTPPYERADAQDKVCSQRLGSFGVSYGFGCFGLL